MGWAPGWFSRLFGAAHQEPTSPPAPVLPSYRPASHARDPVVPTPLARRSSLDDMRLDAYLRKDLLHGPPAGGFAYQHSGRPPRDDIYVEPGALLNFAGYSTQSVQAWLADYEDCWRELQAGAYERPTYNPLMNKVIRYTDREAAAVLQMIQSLRAALEPPPQSSENEQRLQGAFDELRRRTLA